MFTVCDEVSEIIIFITGKDMYERTTLSTGDDIVGRFGSVIGQDQSQWIMFITEDVRKRIK